MGDLRIENGPTLLTCTRSGSPSGPPVLFLHGITSWRDSWLESSQRLGDRFDCWALDFRGHGESDRAPGEYSLGNYASDATAVLDHIGRPTVVVGHSLGGVTATHVAQGGHPLVAALFLEDPPLYAGGPQVHSTTIFPGVFTMLRDVITRMQADDASLDAYVALVCGTPSPMGGVAADHQPERQLRSRARQLQLVDPSVLDPAIDGTLFSDLDASLPIPCPVTLLAANVAYGAAFLTGDDERLLATAPHARIVPFPEVGHAIRGSTVSAARFLDELDAFAAANC
jgi:pimeloyl-ACP methyl ester carboxylesterase